MTKCEILLKLKDCALILLDQQAGLVFGIGSIDRQTWQVRAKSSICL